MCLFERGAWDWHIPTAFATWVVLHIRGMESCRTRPAYNAGFLHDCWISGARLSSAYDGTCLHTAAIGNPTHCTVLLPATGLLCINCHFFAENPILNRYDNFSVLVVLQVDFPNIYQMSFCICKYRMLFFLLPGTWYCAENTHQVL